MSATVFKKEEIFYLKSTITFETVAAIQKEIISLIRNNLSLSVYQIDLKDITEVNSAALGLLVELKKYSMAHKKTIVFLHSPERLLLLAQVCGVSDWLGLV